MAKVHMIGRWCSSTSCGLLWNANTKHNPPQVEANLSNVTCNSCKRTLSYKKELEYHRVLYNSDPKVAT